MSDPASTSALLDGRVPDGGKAMQGAFLWVAASLATALALFGVILLVWSQNEREAGRMIIGSQRAMGYLPVVATQFAAHHGRPNRL